MFVIVLENESAAVTFGPDSPAPYLAKTLTARGAFVPNYYGVGHASLDNYIAMISGQAPNPVHAGGLRGLRQLRRQRAARIVRPAVRARVRLPGRCADAPDPAGRRQPDLA